MGTGSRVVTTHLISSRTSSGPPSQGTPTPRAQSQTHSSNHSSSPGSNAASPRGLPFAHYNNNNSGSGNRDVIVVRPQMFESGSEDEGGDAGGGNPWGAVDDFDDNSHDHDEPNSTTKQKPICVLTSSGVQTEFDAKKFHTTGIQHDMPMTRCVAVETAPTVSQRTTASQYDYVDESAARFTDTVAQTDPPRQGVGRGAGPNMSMWHVMKDDDVFVGQWLEEERAPTPPPPPQMGIQTQPEMQFVHLAIPERHGLPAVTPQYYHQNNEWFEDEMKQCMLGER